MISRREFVGGLLSTAARAATRRPNVLFVSVDDMNDWVGCLGGYPGVSTPNIDRLAARGVLFTNAHCAAPCAILRAPRCSRAWSPARTGIYNNEQYWRPGAAGRGDHPPVLPPQRLLRRRGGQGLPPCGGIQPARSVGQVPVAGLRRPLVPAPGMVPLGQERTCAARPPFQRAAGLSRRVRLGRARRGPRRSTATSGPSISEPSSSPRSTSKPFFLAVGLWHPHIPLFAPQSYYDLYPPERVRLPRHRQTISTTCPRRRGSSPPRAGRSMTGF